MKRFQILKYKFFALLHRVAIIAKRILYKIAQCHHPYSMSVSVENTLPLMDNLSRRISASNNNCNVTLQYPKRAAAAIVENNEYLQKLIPKFGWTIQIFAGYNILPPNYTCFDEAQAVHFTGK